MICESKASCTSVCRTCNPHEKVDVLVFRLQVESSDSRQCPISVSEGPTAGNGMEV